jgi:hypothetical protein
MAVFLWIVSSAGTAQGCVPVRAHTFATYWDGWYRNPGSTVLGVKAVIENTDAYAFPGGASRAFVELEAGGTAGWTSLGPTKIGGTGQRWTELQWTNNVGGDYVQILLPPKTVGDFPNYNVKYSQWWTQFGTLNDQWDYLLNNQTIRTVIVAHGPPPYYEGWTPALARVTGQIVNLGSQMPGYTGTPGGQASMMSNVFTLSDGNHYFQGIGGWDDNYFGAVSDNLWEWDTIDDYCTN